jgi:hypothetical protein
MGRLLRSRLRKFSRQTARAPVTLPGHNLRCAFSALRIPRGQKERDHDHQFGWRDGAKPAQPALRGTAGASDVRRVADAPAPEGCDPSAAGSTTSNGLTGTTGSNLDSQTLQALMDLTQQDPSQQASSSTQSGQAQAAHHHHHGHHHGGGGMQASSTTAPATTASPSSASDPTASAISESQDSTDASLESALLAA